MKIINDYHECWVDRDTLHEVHDLLRDKKIGMETAQNILRERTRRLVTLQPREEYL